MIATLGFYDATGTCVANCSASSSITVSSYENVASFDLSSPVLDINDFPDIKPKAPPMQFDPVWNLCKAPRPAQRMRPQAVARSRC